MRQLNLQYRGMDRTTDVLSFPLYPGEEDCPPGAEAQLGDVVVNVHMAAERARDEGTTLRSQLRTLLVHGILHLSGMDHEDTPHRQRKMKRKERELLRLLGEKPGA